LLCPMRDPRSGPHHLPSMTHDATMAGNAPALVYSPPVAALAPAECQTPRWRGNPRAGRVVLITTTMCGIDQLVCLLMLVVLLFCSCSVFTCLHSRSDTSDASTPSSEHALELHCVPAHSDTAGSKQRLATKRQLIQSPRGSFSFPTRTRAPTHESRSKGVTRRFPASRWVQTCIARGARAGIRLACLCRVTGGAAWSSWAPPTPRGNPCWCDHLTSIHPTSSACMQPVSR